MDTEKERVEQNSSGRNETFKTVKGCTRLDQVRNEDVRNELGIFPLSEKNKIQE
jgi:hypothetical protein